MINQDIAGTSARRALAVAALRVTAVALLILAGLRPANAQPIATAAIGADAKQSCAAPTEYSDELTAAKLAQKATLTYDITGAVYPHYKCVSTEYTTVRTKVSWGEETYIITVADQNGGILFTDTVNANIQKYEECQFQDTLLHPAPINKHIVRHIDISGLTVNSIAGLILSVTGCNTHSPQALSALFNPLPESNTWATLEAPGVPAFVFNQTVSPQKLLTWIDPADLDTSQEPNYPSADQRKPDNDFAGVALGDKPQMFIRGTTNVKAGGRVWLKLIDPPDSAPYVAAVHASNGDDNVDQTARIVNAEGVARKVGKPLPVTVGTTGNVEVVLEGAQHNAGDNYKIIASTDKPDANDTFPCEATFNCVTSVEIAVWKRIYFEHEHMVKAGAFLGADITGSPDPCSTNNPCRLFVQSITVDGAAVISPGTGLTLMAMDSQGFHHESVTVDLDDPNLGPAIVQQLPANTGDPTLWQVRLTSRPSQDYVGNAHKSRVFSDAVAVTVPNTSPDAFSINTAGIRQVLNDAFIEYADAPTNWPYVPYVGVMALFEEVNYITRWYQTLTRGSRTEDLPYHRLLLAGDRFQVGLLNDCDSFLGHTWHLSSQTARLRASIVYERTIMDGALGPLSNFYPATDPGDLPVKTQCLAAAFPGVYGRNGAALEQVVSAHEVVHSFAVDGATVGGDGAGHCSSNEYLGQFVCLMNKTVPVGLTDPQVNAGVMRLHYIYNGPGANDVDSEYAEMRKLHERIP